MSPVDVFKLRVGHADAKLAGVSQSSLPDWQESHFGQHVGAYQLLLDVQWYDASASHICLPHESSAISDKSQRRPANGRRRNTSILGDDSVGEPFPIKVVL